MANYPPVDIFTVQRNISMAESMIWLAITEAKEVKFDTIEQLISVEKLAPTVHGERPTVNFKSKILVTADLVYGIRFNLSVLNFTLCLKHMDGTLKVKVIDFEGTDQAVKEIRFETAVPKIPYHHFEMTYTANPREIPAVMDDTTIFTDYKILHPILTLGVLQDTPDSTSASEQSTSVTIKPIVILRNGAIHEEECKVIGS
ncbi:MAG: hypothetical protein ABIW84_06260 [Ilumatobacteraceae bacterium]